MQKLFRAVTSPKASLWLIVVLALVVRLYRIDNPIGDWHAFRQADTASVTREFVKHGIDLLHPRYHDLSNIQSGFDNPEGFRMVEFPFINGVIACVMRLLPFLPLVFTSRFFSLAASLGTLLFLIGFVQKITKKKQTGWLAGLFFAVLPYSVYYSRAILPEPFLLFFSTGSLYWLTVALETKSPFRQKSWWASAVFLSLALLLKPFVVFLAPVYAVIIWRAGKKIRQSPWWLVYGGIALMPLWAWRRWIQQFPTGIPVSDWLFNGNGIRFRPAWFRWLFWERFTKLILGYTGVLIAAGTFLRRTKGRAELIAWWAGLIIYTAVVATGNVQHDYYQVIFTPLLCFTLALGTTNLWQATRNVRWKQACIILALITGWFGSWLQISGYWNVNHWEYVEAGRAADQLLPANATVIAPAFGDTQFLFQTNRTGWPIGFEIDDKIAKGAQYYLTTTLDDEARELIQRFTVITQTDRYLLLDLTQSRQEETP